MTLHKNDPSNATVIADAELILRTRSGDRAAFGELWRRHYPSGKSVARSITSSIDPDDLVQESYTRIYQAIIKGGGPNGSFRAYLFTSIRNTAAAWGRSRRETTIDELDGIADPNSTEDAADEALDHDLTAQAFRSLPARWQEVLWYTEIERMKPADVAPLLGMKAGAVSQLAFRAREGLREAWIQAHLRGAESGSECRWIIEHLGAHSRGNLSARDQKRVDQHIDDCERCTIVAAEAKDVSGRLALVLLPLVLGVSGASGYVATLQSTLPVAAAIPSGVFESGMAAADGSARAGALAVPIDGGSTGGTPGAAGSSGSGMAGGAITGIGALVGAGSAALIVAGVVAAATIVPGLVDATSATSLPSASDVGNSSISSEVEPDPNANTDDKFVLEIDAEAPEPPVQEDETPEPKHDDSDDAPEASVTSPATPTRTRTNEGADSSEPTTPPAEPEKPTKPDEGGVIDPEEPNLPEVGKGSVDLDWSTFETHYKVPVTGVAGTKVKTLINGSTDGGGETTLAADAESSSNAIPTSKQRIGSGEIDLRPTAAQLCAGDTIVEFFYVIDGKKGSSVSKSLKELGTFPFRNALDLFCDLYENIASDQMAEESAIESNTMHSPSTSGSPVETPSSEMTLTEDPPAALVDESVTNDPEVDAEPATEEATVSAHKTSPAETTTDETTTDEATSPAE